MSRGDLFEATLSNMVFNPENNIEENYKKYHEIYIKYQQGNCGVADSNDLRGIAEKCPFNDGSVVYQARALYNLIFDTRETFPDLCPEDIGAKSMTIANETTEHRDEILLYPNPAKDEVFIALDQPELTSIEITVMDANGKVVFANSVLDVRDGLATFTLDVDNGMYFVNVINPITNESSVEKLVIHK